MIVVFPPEIEKKLVALAAQKHVDPSTLVASWVEKELNEETIPAPRADSGHDDDVDPDALNRAVAALINRTPEQKKAAQEWAMREFKPKNELPPNVSPLEVLPVIRGDETDEQVLLALEEMS